MASFADFPLPRAAAAIALIALGGCTYVPPSGPRVAAMPGTGKTYEQFTNDDATCRQAAAYQAGPGPTAEQSNGTVVGSALLGAGLGAAAGAAIGSASGSAGGGAAVGGALGLLTGTAIGAGNAEAGAGGAQERFDIAYTQCMYAKGNQVPSYQPQPGYGGDPGYGYYPSPYPNPYYRRYWRPYPY
jgi:hypothetical protein